MALPRLAGLAGAAGVAAGAAVLLVGRQILADRAALGLAGGALNTAAAAATDPVPPLPPWPGLHLHLDQRNR